MNNDTNEDQPEKPLTLFQVASSVLSAAFGVQSKANKKRDFARGKPLQFIIVGVVFTMIFLVFVIGLVTMVLS